MDNGKIGELIHRLRRERGLGCPFGATAGCISTILSTACSGRTYNQKA